MRPLPTHGRKPAQLAVLATQALTQPMRGRSGWKQSGRWEIGCSKIARAVGAGRGVVLLAVLCFWGTACTGERFGAAEDGGLPSTDDTTFVGTGAADDGSDPKASSGPPATTAGSTTTGSAIAAPGSGASGGPEQSSSSGANTSMGGNDASTDDIEYDDAQDGFDSDAAAPSDDGVDDDSVEPPGSTADEFDAGSGANITEASVVELMDPSDAGATEAPEENAETSPDAGDSEDQLPPDCAADEQLGPDDHCYYFGTEEFDWDAAREVCVERGEGWDLVAVTTQFEHGWLSDRLVEDTWIGATRVESVWAWASSREPFWVGVDEDGEPAPSAYTRWEEGEPNGGNQNPQCLRYAETAAGFYWADMNCTMEYPFVCELGPVLGLADSRP